METCSSCEIWRGVGRLVHKKCLWKSWLWLMERYQRGEGRVPTLYPFEVGEGSQVQFWQGRWCGDQPLSMAIPDLYDFSLACDALADSLLGGQSDGEPGNWDVSFVRF